MPNPTRAARPTVADAARRLQDLDEALAQAAEFDHDQPELADLMVAVAARWVRTANMAPGSLQTALHALQEADADYVPAADDTRRTLEAAIDTLDEICGNTPSEVELDAAVNDARRLLRDHAAWLAFRSE